MKSRINFGMDSCPVGLPLQYSVRILTLMAFFMALAVPAFCAAYRVIRVYDGDTITVLDAGQKVRIRLVGIDAPERSRSKHKPGQPFSRRSGKYLAGLVLNKMVAVKSYGHGFYGRVLGVVFVDGKNVNLEMVRAGLAEAYRGRPAKGFDPLPYRRAEAKARELKIGMWSLGERYISPRTWRHARRKNIHHHS